MDAKTKTTHVNTERCDQCSDLTQEKMSKLKKDITWIYCETCMTWLHAVCENLNNDEASEMSIDYHCKKCQEKQTIADTEKRDTTECNPTQDDNQKSDHNEDDEIIPNSQIENNVNDQKTNKKSKGSEKSEALQH